MENHVRSDEATNDEWQYEAEIDSLRPVLSVAHAVIPAKIERKGFAN